MNLFLSEAHQFMRHHLYLVIVYALFFSSKIQVINLACDKKKSMQKRLEKFDKKRIERSKTSI